MISYALKNSSAVGLDGMANAVIAGCKRWLGFLEYADSALFSNRDSCEISLHATPGCRVGDDGRYCVATVTAAIDAGNAPELFRFLLCCVSKKRDVILCMSDVSSIDTAGAAILFEVYVEAKKRGLQFILVGANTAVRRVLGLCRLRSMLPHCKSISEALQTLRR